MEDASQGACDRKLHEQILKSVRSHDNEVVNRIQKRRGRKRFLLSGDDHQAPEGSYAGVLSKRDQKYLSKVVQMSDPRARLAEQRQGAGEKQVMADLLEFEDDWPKNGAKPLQLLSKLLDDLNLNHASADFSDDDSQQALQQKIKMRPVMNGGQKRQRSKSGSSLKPKKLTLRLNKKNAGAPKRRQRTK